MSDVANANGNGIVTYEWGKHLAFFHASNVN